eukprot:m.83380 g.83380  ORF g.83380 m.83380 type:complete len:1007 (-) comp14764_c1_seq3:89-3109(-)
MASAEKSLDATNGAPGLAAPKTSDNTHAAASAVASSPLAAALIKQSPGRSTGTPRPRKRSRVAAAVTQPPTHLALPVAALNLATAATATEATTPQATPSQAAPSPSAPAPAPASASVTRAPAADTAAMSISGSTPRSPTSTIPQPAPQQQAQSPVTTVPHAAATTTATAAAGNTNTGVTAATGLAAATSTAPTPSLTASLGVPALQTTPAAATSPAVAATVVAGATAATPGAAALVPAPVALQTATPTGKAKGRAKGRAKAQRGTPAARGGRRGSTGSVVGGTPTPGSVPATPEGLVISTPSPSTLTARLSTPLMSSASIVFTPPAPVTLPSPGCTATELRGQLNGALKVLHDHIVALDSGECRIFLQAVDTRHVPDYLLVIETPIDLSIIGGKIDACAYPTAWEYLDDMWLMFDNCFIYNRPGSFHHRYASKLCKTWQPLVESLMTYTLAAHGYCCGQRRRLAGVSYRCRGGTCFVKYGHQYWRYKVADDEYIIFCPGHYQKLPAEVVLPRYANGTGDEIRFSKTELVRMKHNTPLAKELMVTCDTCGRMHHEVCVMHNAFHIGLSYRCDLCRVATNSPKPALPNPADLPQCTLTRQLEEELRRVSSFGASITLRLVNFTTESSETKPMFRERFPDAPKEFRHTRKCVLAFIEHEGIHECFFGLIVQEYGAECPQPNQQRVYIALLDSVKLPKAFLPSAVRTEVYHTVVRGYLRYAGRRGFKFAHIYTCPPRKGQNYIFPFKPPDQKEISVVRLRQWYNNLLHPKVPPPEPAIVGTKLLGDIYTQPKLTEIPYFDGDNWPEIIEDCIRLDIKALADQKRRDELRAQVDATQQEVWLARNGESIAQCRKPRANPNTQYYEGVTPPDKIRKRRRLSRTNAKDRRPSPSKPKSRVTVEERLGLVLAATKRDFLVVQLLDSEDGFQPDPDAGLTLASTGPDHSVTSFLAQQKLEFTSTRHIRFSTMLLVHMLLSPDKAIFDDLRWGEDASKTVKKEDTDSVVPMKSDKR